MTRARGFAAAVCLALGVAGIVLGVLLAYASRVAFDAEAFSARVSDSLGHDGVATLVANRLADRVIRERRDLTAYRPVIVAAARSLVASAPFRAVVHRAARVSHQAMLSETGQQISLTLQDAGAIVRSALATNPELERRIPAAMNAVVVRLQEAPGAARFAETLRFAKRFGLAPWMLVLAGLGVAALGVALASARRMAILRVGLAIAAIAVAIRIAANFGGYGVALAAADPLVAGAIEGLWEAFLGGLASWALVLASFGVIVAAAVTSRLERVQLQSTGLAAWRWFTETDAGLGRSIARGLILMTAGLLAVIWSEVALHLIALSAGAVLFFVGLREFFGIGLRAIPDRAAATGSTAGRAGTPWARLAFVAGTAAVLIGAGTVFLARWQPAVEAARPAIDACNGHAALCDRRLNEVVFGAAHNAMSAADLPGWMFPNHEKGMPAQLQDGVRALLFDVHYGMPAGDRVKTLLDDEPASRKKYEAVLGAEGIDAAMRIRDRLVGDERGTRGVYLCHGFCELGATPFAPALRQIRDFLVVNPNEVLLIVIEDDGPLPQDVEAAFRESGLLEFVYRGAIGPPWPTLREMIAADQRVVVFAENDSAGVDWYHQAYAFMQETPYKFRSPAEFSCRANRGPATAPLFLVNHWIETAPAPKPSNAERVNAYDTLLARARACQQERRMLPNVVAVDFYRSGDLLKVVDALNGFE